LQLIAGEPSEFEYLPTMFNSLISFLDMDVLLFPKEEQDRIMENADDYLLYVTRNRAIFKVIDSNSVRFKARNLTKAEIKTEIESNRNKLMKNWDEGFEDPFEEMIEDWKMTGVYEAWNTNHREN
ncbi:hypothetical protein PFISCL1PPCAC_19110, partial [Pristionchus fissidentatus]